MSPTANPDTRAAHAASARLLSRRSKWSLFVLAFVAALLAAGCAQLTVKEREMVFRVEPGTARWFSALPEGVQEIDIPVATTAADSGAKPGDKPPHIHAWWWPAADAAAPTANSNAPAILYLHGARWNLTGHLFRLEQLRAFGFSVLAIDYRGFGKSDGDLPSEATVYEDAYAAWQRMATLQPDASKRYIYGHSLGGAVAVDLALRLNERTNAASAGGAPAARGLIIESSFTTLADIARSLTSELLPAQLILSQKFDALGKIAGVRMPVLVVHGKDDRYVPSRFSEELFAAARGPKKLLLIDGGTHNNSMRTGSEAYRQALADLFGLDAKGERVGIVQR